MASYVENLITSDMLNYPSSTSSSMDVQHCNWRTAVCAV